MASMNVDYINYKGGRNFCRDEATNHYVHKLFFGNITFLENYYILPRAKIRQRRNGGLLREAMHIEWHLLIQHAIGTQSRGEGTIEYDILKEVIAA